MGDRQGSGSDRRSGSRPDPTTGVQALVDVQRRGLHAANELVDRLIRSVDRDSEGSDGAEADTLAAGSQHNTPAGSSAAGPTDDLVRLWVEVVRLGLETFGHFLTPRVPGRSDNGSRVATLDVGTAASTGVIRIAVFPTPSAGESTDRANAEVWLHNGSAAAYSAVALHCGDLRASDGAVLPAALVSFDPSITDLPARSSRGVVVSVSADVAPGTYRGVVLVAGVPDAWLPIEVVKNADQHEG